jgi:hypothetical protein
MASARRSRAGPIRLTAADTALLGEVLAMGCTTMAETLLTMHRRNPDAQLCGRLREWLDRAEALQARLVGRA